MTVASGVPTSTLSNLLDCLVNWAPSLCSKVLFPLELVHSLNLRLLAHEAATGKLEY